ncbi:DNA polymerase, partial [Litorivivens sp.]
LQSSDVDAAMIMQVHDELILEVAENQVDSVSQQLEKLMEGAAQLAVPLEVGLGVGNNWDEAH